MDEKNRVAMGRYIRQVREGKGISLQEFAWRLSKSEGEVIQIEAGERMVLRNELDRIARALGINIDTMVIFYGENPVISPAAEKLFTRESPAGACLKREP